MRDPQTQLLCAMPNCKNLAPGRLVLRGPNGGHRVVTRNLCEKCVARIRRKYKIQ